MSTDLEALEAEVLKLAPSDRSHLLERLIVSLDADPEIEEAWEREADRREAELNTGGATAVPRHEALRRLRSRTAARDVSPRTRAPVDWGAFIQLREQLQPLPDDFLAERDHGECTIAQASP